MPIRPENRDRYPADWPEISRRIRFARALGRCECEGECGLRHTGRCTARHNAPNPRTGTKVVLTVAHLVSATQLPMDLHVTRATHTGEVVELVGLLVPLNPERLEGDEVVHDRALSEFLAGPTASSARFVVALPSGTTCSVPSRPVVLEGASRPEWVVLSGWSLGRPPGQAADVSTEAPPLPQVVAGNAVLGSASLADSGSERSLGAAYQFSATGLRASEDVVRRLLRRDRDYLSADGALDAALAPALCSAHTGALDPRPLFRHELEPAAVGAGPSGSLGIVREVVSAGSAGDLSGAQSGSRHAQLYHLGYLPENCDDANLKAMCQGCHLHYDRDHHAETAARTRAAAIAEWNDPLPGLEPVVDAAGTPMLPSATGAIPSRAFMPRKDGLESALLRVPATTAQELDLAAAYVASRARALDWTPEQHEEVLAAIFAPARPVLPQHKRDALANHADQEQP